VPQPPRARKEAVALGASVRRTPIGRTRAGMTPADSCPTSGGVTSHGGNRIRSRNSNRVNSASFSIRLAQIGGGRASNHQRDAITRAQNQCSVIVLGQGRLTNRSTVRTGCRLTVKIRPQPTIPDFLRCLSSYCFTVSILCV
jgi:hypothetical protein